MRYYDKLKANYPDAVLLFLEPSSNKYLAFHADARIVSDVVKTECWTYEETPCCGFAYESLDTWLPKLVRAGYRVAICETLEDNSNNKTKSDAKRYISRTNNYGA